MDDHRASNPGQPGGFTLIELVVTITLLGVVLASAAQLGRHAIDQIRVMPTVADRTLQVHYHAYLIRRMDEIAVLLSWNDSTLTYLDNCGMRRQITLTALGITIENDPATIRAYVHPGKSSALSDLAGNSANGPSGVIPDTTQVMVHLVLYSANFDSLSLARTVPFLPFQR